MKISFANLGHITSVLLVSLLIMTGCHEQENASSKLEKAMEKLRTEQVSDLLERAQRGDPVAQYTLGNNHSMG